MAGFFDGAGKTVKFDGVNQGASGFIVAQFDQKTGEEVPYVETQQTDYTTKEPKVWKDGNPMMQAVIKLQTDMREDEDDDGLRTLYVDKTRLKRAIQNALRIARNGDVAVGGVLTVWMTGEERTKAGMTAKTFEATYAPPAPSAGSLATGETSAPPAPPSAPPVAPPSAPPVAPPSAPPVANAPTAAPSAPPSAPPAPPTAPVAPPSVPSAPPSAPPTAPPSAPRGSESDLPF